MPPSGRIVAPHLSRPAAPADDAEVRKPFPLLTCSLLLLLALVFVGEQAGGLASGGDLAFSYPALIAIGGVSRDLVASGEWWRLAAAPLLHGGVSHLIGNGVVLLFAGMTLERLVGRGWLAGIFAASALGGVAGSVLLNSPAVVSVGASGAVMGLLAAMIACSFHIGAYEQRTRLRWIGARLMIPALIPFGGLAGVAVDYNAHLGGAAVGGLAGFILLVAWPETEARPSLRGAMAGLGLAGLALGAVGLLLAALHFPAYAARARDLVPASELPRTRAERAARSEDLVRRFPHDPQARLVQGLHLLDINDPAGAEAEIRRGLAEREVLARDLPPAVTWALQMELVGALLFENKKDEAIKAARPLVRQHLDGPQGGEGQAHVPPGRDMRRGVTGAGRGFRAPPANCSSPAWRCPRS